MSTDKVSETVSTSTTRKPILAFQWDKYNYDKIDDAKTVKTIAFSYDKGKDNLVHVRYGATIYKKDVEPTKHTRNFTVVKKGVMTTAKERYSRKPVEFDFMATPRETETETEKTEMASQSSAKKKKVPHLEEQIKRQILKTMVTKGVRTRTKETHASA